MKPSHDLTGAIDFINLEGITVRELAVKLIALTNSSARLVTMPIPQDDPRRRCPDISKARAQLGWTPHTPFVDGLKKTINYFEELLRDKRVRYALNKVS